jgi:hypothetical protein
VRVAASVCLLRSSTGQNGCTGYLFTFALTYSEGNPIEHVAKPIDQLLLALRQAEREIHALL